MIRDFDQILSDNIKGMKRSAIRELLKLTQDPEVISFAGGLPAPDTFPVEELKSVVIEVLNEKAGLALQYGATEGDTRLRELLVERYRSHGFNIDMENLIITTASQQGLDLLAKIFINRGDRVIVGLPSYLGGLSAFFSYGAKPAGICFDKDGMRPDCLEDTLQEMKKKGEKPKFIYTIPDFQNPAGVTMPDERRQDILDIAHRHDLLIIEDSPYKELRFEGKDQQSLYTMDGSGQVINLGTFSKIFVPGFRIGWVIADKKITDKFVIAKQATDLCTSPFVQMIAAKYIEKGVFDLKLKEIIFKYREKRDAMMKAFEEYMPPGVTWTRPQGGLFLFLRLPEHMDSEQLFLKAIKKKVAFVVGAAFHCDGSGKNTMRINFSFMSKEKNIEGVKRLAEVIREEL
ncbi:MAG: PLP-dependent aminotransferase family protein [Candidatus Cloacimonetes bacterium]|nr:PLP-dependent aminotransferase family protein [Candidatus Cloacimonadota bacterium]